MRLRSYHDTTLEAKTVAIEDELARRGARLKRVGRELVDPCPVCGGNVATLRALTAEAQP